MILKKVVFVLVCFLVFITQAKADVNIEVIPEEYQLDLYSARVLEIKDVIVSNNTKIQIADIKILNKKYKNQIFEVRNTLTNDNVYDILLRKNKKVSVHIEEKDGEINAYVIGHERSDYLLQLTFIFLFFLLIIGGIKGLKSIVALSITIALIIYVLIPLLLRGYNPILISTLVCTLATIITFLIIAGFNKKSTAAIIGTIGGLVVGGTIAYIYGIVAQLTGFSSSDAQMLLYLPNQINLDFRGLLFAGIIIGALGACMDVSISIASSLTEIQKENPNIKLKSLMQSGLNIGKDIMGTMVNTLILAYTGGALTTMLIFIGFERQISEIINLDSVATEIIRALTGSIGLLFAIPITILAYAFLNKIEMVRK